MAKYLIVTSAILLSVPYAQAIIPITQAFTVASGNAAGSCDGQSNLLSNIWAECLVLTEAALDAINDFPTNTNIQELFYTFWSQDVLDDPNTQEDIDDIRGWFQDVQNFINGNGQVFAQGPAGGPLLYCDDTWLTKHAWTDDAEDANGLVTDQNPNSPTFGQTLSIQEVGVVRSNTYLTYWNQNPQPVPYWSGAPLNAYIFDSPYTNQGGSYCAAGNLAGTQDDTPRTTITLCPASFVTGPTTAHDTFLGESDPEVNDEVEDSSCLSLTLFHELFHAVEGKPNTPDATTRSGAAEAISLAANNDRRCLDNPETYTWFALTAWYYYNKNAWFRAGEDTADN